jgi:hypothetical protein
MRRVLVFVVATVLLVGALLAAGACRGPATSPRGGDEGRDPDGAALEATRPGAASTASPGQDRVDPRKHSILFTVGWVGDITPGSSYGDPPDKGRPLFEHVKAELRRPDLMLGNLEGTLSKGGVSKCAGKDPKTCYAFQAPPENAVALAEAGFDMLSLANNHARDYFDHGMDQTFDALKKNGIRWCGLDDEAVPYVQVKGVRVAVVGFAPYSWAFDLRDIEWAKRIVGSAAKNADVVVVVMHAGAEGADKTRTPRGEERAYGENRGDVRGFSHAVIDSGADVVLGSGPHVLRGMERYRGRLIAYSLANFAGWGNFDSSGVKALSGILVVEIDGTGAIRDGRLHSVRLVDPGVPKPDPSNEAVSLVRRLSDEDFESPWGLGADGTFRRIANPIDSGAQGKDDL